MLILLCVNLVLTFYYWLVVLPFGWHNFFIALLVFTILFFFAVTGTGFSFLCLVLPSGALVVPYKSSGSGLVVAKSLSNYLSIKDFTSLSVMKLSLAVCEILG